jgi:two-component system, NtrC family, sensor kinase
MRLAWKLAFGVTGVIVLVTGAKAVSRVQREAQLFESEIAQHNRVLARAVAQAATQTWQASGEQAAIDLVDNLTPTTATVLVRWVWLDRDGDGHGPHVPLPANAWPEHAQRYRPAASEERLYHYTRIDVGSGAAAIEVSESLSEEHAYLRATLVRSALTTGALVALSAAIVFALCHAFVGRPVRRLVEHARRIGDGDLHSRLALRQTDEIGELARELDVTAERLEASREQLLRESSARLAMAEQLRHADRLASVGRLGAGIAHELGTPLNIVIGHASMLCDELPASKHHTTIIVDQARRAAAIIRQLLDFARRRTPRRAPVDVHALAEQTVGLMKSVAAKRKVELDVHGDPAIVHADGTLVQQALLNLLENAVHAVDASGRVTVEVSRTVAVKGGQHGGYVRLAVVDTGPGIPPETLDRVFEPFFTTKGPGEGTGLGLCVAFGIAQDHGGWLEAASELGAGARFTIFLPEAA